MTPTVGPKDIHYVVDGKTNNGKVYDHSGKLLYDFVVYPHGVNGPSQSVTGGDTVAELYKLGKPIWTQNSDSDEIKREYGWVFTPMIDYEGKEAALGRAGFGCHGGGHWNDHWLAKQILTWTMGCVRHHNEDAKTLALLVEKILSEGGICWMTVLQ